jgi:acyl-CoA thioesterase-1
MKNQKTLSLFFLFLSLFFTPLSGHANSAAPKKLLALGDSLTEGYGVARDKAYPALVEQKLKQAGLNWQVINAGISGSTSSSAPNRLKWQLRQKPDAMILALGANDGLRGLKISETEKNLSIAIEMAQKNGVRVFLFGMKLPTNYGDEYRKDFEAMFQRVSKKYSVPLLPFFLDRVAGDPKLNLPDGIHPNEKGYEIVAENVFKFLKDKL